MNKLLNQIIEQKQKEVALLKKKNLDFTSAKKNLNSGRWFKNVFAQQPFAIIGEIKRKSPSKGDIALIKDPLLLVEQYVEGGVSAISVLTDEKYFSGSMDDLIKVSEYLKDLNIPVLRKEFIIDEVQITESVYYGANAILLIVAVLQEKTKTLLDYANHLGIEAIVEVHNEEELEQAIKIGAEIIGINNRDLHTFQEDLQVCLRLIKKIPKTIYTIAESAVRTVEDIKKIKAAGFHAVLIGETLVRAKNPAALIHKMREIP